MKKLLCLIGVMFILTGCNIGQQLSNTPTKRVEAFLNKYQTLDADVLDSLDRVIAEDNNFNSDQRTKYRDVRDAVKNNCTQM